MRSLRLMWIEPALLRLAIFAGNAPTNSPLETEEESRAKGRSSAMLTSLDHSSRAKTSLSLMLALILALFVSVAAPKAFAQEETFGDSSTPLVYSVENTGAKYAAPVFPAFGQLPIIRPLPDPFRSVDGRRRPWFNDWERRRNQIKAAIETYEIGPKPDCSDCTITANYVPPAPGSTARGTLTVVVTRNGKSLTLTSGIYLPSTTTGAPFPVLIAMTFFASASGPNYGSLPSSAFAGLPVATVDFVHNQVASLSFGFTSHSADPFYQLYPELCAGVCSSGTSNSGEYAAWSWGVSRLIDGMEIASRQALNPLPIDMKHLAVTGCSYAGKMALFAGAFDERIALTIAQENGGGGAPSWRVSHEIEANRSVEDIDDTSYEWFGQQMKQFAGDNVYKLPTDHDELMAMVAPRALLETGNTDFYWLSNRSNYISARATQRVYNTFGIGDRFGFYIDGGHAHCGTLPAEAPAIASFVNKFMLGQASISSDIEVTPFPTLDYERWTWWWEGNPNKDPKFPNDWNTGGTVVMSLKRGDLRSLAVSEGNTVQGSYQLSIRGPHPAATVGVIGANVQTDVKCSDGTSYTLTIPMPENQTYTIPARNHLYYPGPTVYQGSATAPACSSGVSQGVIEGAYFSALGLSTTVGNPPTGSGFTTTDSTDPLDVTFGCSANGVPSNFAPPITVNFQH